MNERRRLSDIVASRIRDFIIENSLESGDRLPTELELAKQFGVSRVSIREATKSLCFLGFLDATPRRGTTVGQINFSRVSHFLELHPALRYASSRELIETRWLLESGVLPYVIDRFQQVPARVEDFRQLLTRFSPDMDVADWLDLDCEFHNRLVDASGLAPLFLFQELLAFFFNRLQQLAQNPDVQDRLRSEMQDRAAEHQRIISLLRDQQLEPAQHELKRHISSYLPILELSAVN